MHLSLVPMLRCTVGCDSTLELKDKVVNDDIVSSGLLACPVCNRAYIISNGIPRMLPDHLRKPARMEKTLSADTIHQQKEMQARDAQVGDYDRMWHLTLYGLLEIPMTIRSLDICSRHILLEAGCGTGRMTEQFARKSKRVIAVDFSWESLLSCAQKLRDAGVDNVDLIQADLCNMPLNTDMCDRVVSCGVLEHIPTSELRHQAIRELSRVLKPDQTMVVSAYKHSIFTRLFGSKEGEHDGGIYYYRFTKPELYDLLKKEVNVSSINGTLMYYYTARCVNSGS